jgi:hypothetical protein
MPPQAPPPPRPPSPQVVRSVISGFAPIAQSAGHRVVLYGPGGIGKTTLAACAPGPVVFFDFDDSLPRLRDGLPGAEAVQVCAVATWQAMRDALHADQWGKVRTVVIDSATRAEELCVEHVIKTIPHEKGNRIQRIEDYGWGKGYRHVYDEFLKLLADLDAHTRAGRNVVLICHEQTANVPNPSGDDWLRYEPRLQQNNQGAVRLRVKEWADHVLFVGYDVDVKDGKGRGSGTRTIYPTELPFCMAKSRTLAQPVVLNKNDASLWAALLK